MRLGIFGDSYAAFRDLYETCQPWPNILPKLLQVDHYIHTAIGGSSHWFSYEKFIKHYQNCDVIIFIHTNCERWPCTKPGIEGKAWNIGYVPDPDMDEINKVRRDIFSSPLLQFISLNIFKEVNQRCREEGKYLINIFPFPDDYEIPKTEFPIIRNIDLISHSEKTKYQKHFPKLDFTWRDKFNNWYSESDVFYPTAMINGTIQNELRECHLNCKNNIRFANLLLEIINKREYNKVIDCLEYEWDWYDEEMDKIYEENINNR